MLSGWGRVEEGGDWSRTLKRARMPIVSDQECTRNVRLTHNIKIMVFVSVVPVSQQFRRSPIFPIQDQQEAVVCWQDNSH